MPGNEIARILDADTSFDTALEQIAEHAHDGYHHAAENGEPEVDLIQARPPDDDPNDDGTKKTAEETLPAFLGRDLGNHLVLTKATTDHVGKGIREPQGSTDADGQQRALPAGNGLAKQNDGG